MNLLITGAWRDAEAHFHQLEEQGHTISFMRQEDGPLPCDPQWVEGVICNGLFLYHPIDSFPRLRFIQLTSAGFDRVPMAFVREKGIEIHNARGVYSIPMAEFALAGVLSIYKGFAQFQRQQERHIWQKNRDLRELAGKRVLIVGCGDVGQECAKRFKAFETIVIGINRTSKKLCGFDKIEGLNRLDAELELADVVIVTIALCDETKGLVKARKVKPDGILVNISRGGTVDLEGSQCSLVLDVFDEEPLDENDALWDEAVITPHSSFIGEHNDQRLWLTIEKNVSGVSW